jgi:integrase/recombinase XerD
MFVYGVDASSYPSQRRSGGMTAFRGDFEAFEPGDGELLPRLETAPLKQNPYSVSEPEHEQRTAWETSAAIVERFLADYRGATLTAYRHDLRTFAAWSASQGLAPLAAERHHLQLYRNYLVDVRHLAPATVGRRLSTVAGMMAYAVDEGVLLRDPMRGVRRPKVDNESSGAALSGEEVLAAFAAAESDPRLHALVQLLFFTGMRISSALGLDVRDLRREQGYRIARYRAKGGKDGVAVLPETVTDALTKYLAGRATGPVFLGSRGGRWSRVGAWRDLRRLGTEIMPDRPEALHPHAWRASFATHAYLADCGTEDIRQSMLHSDGKTSQRYQRARERLDRHPAHRLQQRLYGQE